MNQARGSRLQQILINSSIETGYYNYGDICNDKPNNIAAPDDNLIVSSIASETLDSTCTGQNNSICHSESASVIVRGILSFHDNFNNIGEDIPLGHNDLAAETQDYMLASTLESGYYDNNESMIIEHNSTDYLGVGATEAGNISDLYTQDSESASKPINCDSLPVSIPNNIFISSSDSISTIDHLHFKLPDSDSESSSLTSEETNEHILHLKLKWYHESFRNCMSELIEEFERKCLFEQKYQDEWIKAIAPCLGEIRLNYQTYDLCFDHCNEFDNPLHFHHGKDSLKSDTFFSFSAAQDYSYNLVDVISPSMNNDSYHNNATEDSSIR